MARIYRMTNAPTAQEYVRGLRRINHRVTDDHRRYFRFHYHSPDRTAGSPQLAALGGDPQAKGKVNSLYGHLGRELCEALDIVPDLQPYSIHRWWSVWSTGWKTPGGFVWKMLPQVAEALEELGWVQILPIVLPGEIEESTFIEGAVTQRWVNAYERDPGARAECVTKHGTACIICGCDFGKRYGSEFAGFIHVHHLVPLSKIAKEYQVNPETDLIPVCPNCHAVIHHGGELRTPDKVKELLKRMANSEAP